jgi:hypothetical protein
MIEYGVLLGIRQAHCMVQFVCYTRNDLIVFRLASCGSDKMIKLWGREGDGYFILELIELLKFVYRRTKLGV